MSIPQRLYNSFRSILNCELVRDQVVSDNSIAEFQQLLVDAQPINEQEAAQRALVWGMYQSNQVGFMNYVNDRANRVGPIILWTESKRISQYFRLKGLAHISYKPETSYVVVHFRNNPLLNGHSKRRNKRRGPRGAPAPAPAPAPASSNLNSDAPEFQLNEYQPLSQDNPQEQPKSVFTIIRNDGKSDRMLIAKNIDTQEPDSQPNAEPSQVHEALLGGVVHPDVPEPDVPEPDVPEPDVPEPDVPEPDVPDQVLSVSVKTGRKLHRDAVTVGTSWADASEDAELD